MLRPILDRVLVRRLEEAKKPDSLIDIPDQYVQKSRKCEVLALGHGVVLGGAFVPLEDFLQVGDIVLISDYGDEELKDADQDLILVRIQDIRGFDVDVRRRNNTCPTT